MAAFFCILNHGPFLNVPEHWSLYDTDTYADCPLHPEPGWPALLTIDNEHARAEISLFGAHVLRYQRHSEPASLWLSDKAILDGSKPIRGGIPLCWPWFGPSPLALAAASRLMASHATACGRWMGSPITGWHTRPPLPA